MPGAPTNCGRAPISPTLSAMLLATVFALAATTLRTASAHASGAELFVAHCAVCHQPGGRGIPGMYPPLADSVGEFARSKAGRAYLAHVLSFGLNGPIMVRGARFDGYMQSWAQLSDEDIAELLNDVLMGFNAKLLPKDFAPYTAREVKRDRARLMTSSDVYRELESIGTASVKAEVAK